MVASLVIGGAGFIGSNLVHKLILSNQKVDIIDNMTTGNENNLKDLKSKVKIISRNILDLNESKLANYDLIFYLGMPSSSPMYKNDPRLVDKTIGEALFLLENLRKISFKGKVILASSSSVYNGNNPPYSEDMNIKVTDYYTECRFYIERIFELYYNLYNVKTIALRFFSVYGPREEYKGKYANMITQFLWNYLKKEVPVIYGDGSQTRDFTYVDDITDACVLASNSDIEWDVFNVGTGIELSFNDILEKLNQYYQTNKKPIYKQNPIKNYVQRTLSDITKIKLKLNFKPKISITEGIKKIDIYYKNIL